MDRIKWGNLRESIITDDIITIEKELNIKLPNDYIECITKYHCGGPTPYRIDIANNTIVFGYLLSLRNGEYDYILQILNNIDGRILERIYPFADDPGGNYYCFDYRECSENPKIVYYRSELGIGADDYSKEDLAKIDLKSIQAEALEYICDSFTELLEKLY